MPAHSKRLPCPPCTLAPCADDDHGDWLWYTGEGGRAGSTGGVQTHDQEWERGNLSLRRACEQQVPVRVIRALPREDDAKKTDYSFDVSGSLAGS